MNIRILTYNIHKGFSSGNRDFILHNIKESIDQVHADVVFLQEVLGEHALHASNFKNWPTKTQFEFLADQTWPHFAYGKNAVYPDGHHGNALLSKYPILSFENEDVSFSRIERRGLLHTELQLENYPHSLHAFSLHLGLFEKDREAQIGKLCKRILASVHPEAPVIIAGDFNDWRQSAHDYFKEHLHFEEAFKVVTGRYARTFPSIFPVLPLDRVYFRNLTCKSVHALRGGVWKKLSDHLPLLAEFELKGP